jgi:hypothetical protein
MAVCGQSFRRRGNEDSSQGAPIRINQRKKGERKMKKVLSGLLSTAVLMFFMVTPALAKTQ